MKQKPDSRELLRNISKLSSEAEWTPDENRESLAEAGIRATDVIEPIVQLVERLKKESPLHWKTRAEAMRQSLLEKVHSRITAEASGLSRSQLLDKVKQAIGQLPAEREYAVAFRKFEEATEDDLRSMLEELAIIAEIEKDQH
jgi:enamine deaminase RidA (YjgF/YER057c/UK114 family)